MKKLLFCLLFVPTICLAANDDISDRPELGTAVNTDSILAVNAGNTAGDRLARILFQGTAGYVLTGNGTWFDLTSALAGKAAALGADDYYVTSAEKIVIGNTSGTNTGDVAPLATVRTTAGGGSTTAPPSEAATGDELVTKVAVADVVEITAGTGLSFDSGTNTLNLDNTAVTPAEYTNPTVTVNQQGQVTAIANGAAAAFALDTYPTYEDSPHTGSGIAVNGTTLAVWSPTASKWLTASLTDSLDPSPVTYTMNLTLSGISGLDKVTVVSTDYTASTAISGLNSATTTLTGVPDTGREVACSGTAVTGTTPNYQVDMSDSNEDVSCTFSASAPLPDFYYAMETKTTTPDIGATMTTNTGTVVDANGANGNCLVYTAGAGDKFVNIGLSNIDNTVGTIDFYYRPDYTGYPTTAQFPFFASTTFQVSHGTDGGLIFTYAAKYSSIAAWSPTSGTWYHIVAKYDSVGGTYSLQIDSGTPGTASGATTAPTITSANFGRQYKTDQTFAIDEVKVWKSYE